MMQSNPVHRTAALWHDGSVRSLKPLIDGVERLSVTPVVAISAETVQRYSAAACSNVSRERDYQVSVEHTSQVANIQELCCAQMAVSV